MESFLKEKTKLKKLSKTIGDLLGDIVDEKLPEDRKLTKLDIEFKSILFQIYVLSPDLSESYMNMYNQIQKDKIGESITYYKRLRIDENILMMNKSYQSFK